MSLDQGEARRLIRSLARGTTIPDGVRYIHVGYDSWLSAQHEVLEELPDYNGSETKFVKGHYGMGKTHFLHLVQEEGRNRNWVTAHLECQRDEVEIDRFETLYPKICMKLRFPHSEQFPELEDRSDPMVTLVETWVSVVKNSAGIRAQALRRPVDAASRIYQELQKRLFKPGLPSNFKEALIALAMADLKSDIDTKNLLYGWFKGEDRKIQVPEDYLRQPDGLRNVVSGKSRVLRPIGRGTARSALGALLWLIKQVGCSGLVLCIDEIEELAKLRLQNRRDQALQALREHVDNAGGDDFGGLCLYLAATPEMFENPAYFPRYEALQTRIQQVGKDINWRGPVIDLEKTPLEETEMKGIARKIVDAYQIAYGETATEWVTDSVISNLVFEVLENRERTGKPRLLARKMVELLNDKRGFEEEGDPNSGQEILVDA